MFRRMLGIHTILGSFFRLGRDAVSRFYASLQRTKVKICCCTVLQVLQWLAGVCVERFYYFLTNLRASNAYKRPLLKVEGSAYEVAFLCTLTANCRRVELLFSVSCNV